MLPFHRVLLLIAAALTIAWLRLGSAAEIAITHLSFQSGGITIAVDRYAPATGKGRAAIIVLHGAGGLLFDGPEMRRIAQRLAQDGDEAYFIHYFDRTGTLFGLDSNMQQHFEQWLATVHDAVGWVQLQHGDAAPIGLFGYSLGAFLAVAASSNDPRVGTTVEQSGGIWNNKTTRIGRLPPILLIHGRQDRRVPFAKYAEPLLAVVKRRARFWETRYYPGEAHVFTAAGRASVRDQAAQWFLRRLPARR